MEAHLAPERIDVLTVDGQVRLATGTGWEKEDYTEYVRADLYEENLTAVAAGANAMLKAKNDRIAELEQEVEESNEERDIYNESLERIAASLGIEVDREGFPQDFAAKVEQEVAELRKLRPVLGHFVSISQEFLRKVDEGKAQSTHTYGRMQEAMKEFHALEHPSLIPTTKGDV